MHLPSPNSNIGLHENISVTFEKEGCDKFGYQIYPNMSIPIYPDKIISETEPL